MRGFFAAAVPAAGRPGLPAPVRPLAGRRAHICEPVGFQLWRSGAEYRPPHGLGGHPARDVEDAVPYGISEPMTVVTYLGPFCLRGTTKGGVSIMRTLKKSLALVLALVMVLGLGVVGASADNALDNYTDTGDIGDAYLEAVGVLTGLGIVDGIDRKSVV